MVTDKFELESALRKILAIEMLEYEDKTLLKNDNKTNAEIKMTLLENALTFVTEVL